MNVLAKHHSTALPLHSLSASFTRTRLFRSTLASPPHKLQHRYVTMSVQYAKDQPAGFKNKIEKVAIVGVRTFASAPVPLLQRC